METIINKPLNSIWLKASVVGSIWASIEIILGSFLHNLRFLEGGGIPLLFTIYQQLNPLECARANRKRCEPHPVWWRL
jgi:hypothetical protein